MEKHDRPLLSLVVPVYNEEQRLSETFGGLVNFAADQGMPAEVIFVDDGSTDGTAEFIANRLDSSDGAIIRLLRQPHQGKGAAIRAGLEVAEGEYSGFCDVDLSTPLADLARVLGNAQAQGEALAIASRNTAGSVIRQRQHPSREWIGRLYNRLLRLTLIRGTRDTQCGAKVARTAVWRRVLHHCDEPGLAWDAEVVAVAQRLGIPVVEVPVAWSHDERSRVQPLRDGIDMLRAVRRIRARTKALTGPSRPASLANSSRPSVSQLSRESQATIGNRTAPDDGRETDRGGVFDAEQGETLLVDSEHWWFRSKATQVKAHALAQIKNTSPDAVLVDLGAGAGGVTALLQPGLGMAIAVDGSYSLCRESRDRHGLKVAVAASEDVALRRECADVVTLLDVIEHLHDPIAALTEARRLLRPEGHVVVTVPGHQWLWSEADEFLGHRLRYTRRLLERHLREAGFQVVGLTHVFSWAVPAVWVQRVARRRGDLGLGATSPLVDGVARALTAIEQRITLRVSLPFGTSVLAVGRQPHRAELTSGLIS